MKKVLMAAMTLVMAVFASCTNEDLKVENNDVKVNFTVAEKPSFDADGRAVKTGWEAGDEILIALYCSDGWYNENGVWSEDGRNCKVVAWMPLPAPYKEDMRGGKNE